MTDPISSISSVITILGATAGATQCLITFVRRYSKAPDELHKSLQMLESLHLTLTSLQECNAFLDPRYQFSPHFAQRLKDCDTTLQQCVNKTKKTENEIIKRRSQSKGPWSGIAKRSRGKIRWMLFESQEMEKLMRFLQLYQFEFSLELFRILMYAPSLIFKWELNPRQIHERFSSLSNE